MLLLSKTLSTFLWCYYNLSSYLHCHCSLMGLKTKVLVGNHAPSHTGLLSPCSLYTQAKVFLPTAKSLPLQFYDAHSGRLHYRSALFSRPNHHNSGDSPFSSFSFLSYPQCSATAKLVSACIQIFGIPESDNRLQFTLKICKRFME